ncbi:hypothetical protein [Piscinibacter sp. XHJ-5]|uniref:hypothetical protein n=1 Tax=Piscinibacter sp. XHJ-5 TaxID=3037797 RepID=UPI0024530BF6|nr:hypothetical protein [Piscinibacter sp. XHJ-5]
MRTRAALLRAAISVLGKESGRFATVDNVISESGMARGTIPVELAVHGESTIAEIREAAVDALGLGRLNWNTADEGGGV